MKKIFAISLSCVLLFLFCGFGTTLNAKKTTNSSEEEKTVAFVSIYDNIQKVYIVENQQCAFPLGSTISDSLETLKKEEKIAGYQLNGSILEQLVTDTNAEYLYKPTFSTFIVKRNGSTLNGAQWSEPIQTGDIIEWIYCVDKEILANTNPTESEETSSTTEILPSLKWSEEYSKQFNQACDWLEKNADKSESYLMVFGIAGKTANTKIVNQFASNLTKQTEYENVTALSKQALSATFCGFDVRAEKYGGLLKKLTTYPDPMKQGVFGAINPLTAYDSNQYPVGNAVPNSRDVLIQNILNYQKEDGGFSITEKSASDLDTTAMAITALSTYRDRANVKQAIEKAFVFLDEQQTEEGGFGFRGQENCESLAMVIIACCSMDIPLNDQRFMVGETNLLDQLMEYQKENGSFSHIKETDGSIMPTEQALLAMSAIKKGGNPYILSKKIQPPVEDTTTTHVPLQISGRSWIVWVIIGSVIVLCIVAIIAAHRVMSKRTKE